MLLKIRSAVARWSLPPYRGTLSSSGTASSVSLPSLNPPHQSHLGTDLAQRLVRRVGRREPPHPHRKRDPPEPPSYRRRCQRYSPERCKLSGADGCWGFAQCKVRSPAIQLGSSPPRTGRHGHTTVKILPTANTTARVWRSLTTPCSLSVWTTLLPIISPNSVPTSCAVLTA